REGSIIMNNKDFLDIGEQIKNITKEIIDSKDFKELNHDISSTVNGALEEVRRQLKNNAYKHEQQKSARAQFVKSAPIRKIKVNPVGKVAGTLYTVFGSIGIGITSVLLLVLFIVGTVIGLASAITTPLFWGVAGLFAIFAIMLGRGNVIRGKLKRLKRYTAELDGKMYCSTKELAEYVGRSRRFVMRDLRMMIRHGMLTEAYLDEKENLLILDKDRYRQHVLEQNAMKQQKEQKEQASNEANKKRTSSSKLSPLMKEGLEHIKVLREVNDEIPGEIISAKLLRLETIIVKIFDSVERNPKYTGDMRKFMEYYLPTTLKLVKAYGEFERVDIQGENITTAKKEIEETLDTINEAFEHFLDDLYQEAAFDVTTDAEVLQSMLARDGWTETDFK
ncbi:MAG: 5-bromo-4-chloroindolyl phosphate hydrolysis family protein, partial [Niameybacter sp.]